MSTGKSVQKSIRLSEEAYAYIDGYRGANFSERLENLVYDAMLSEPERVRRLAELDAEIQERRKKLRALVKDCTAIDTIRQDANIVSHYLSRIVESLDSVVIHNCSGVPAAADDHVIQGCEATNG